MQAQDIWGVGTANGLTAAEFQADFIATGAAGSYSDMDWTALSINQDGGSQSPGAAYWERSMQGVSQGAYWGALSPISSPSQENGVALFDSDFMDNGGVAGNPGSGTAPGPHRGELVSPLLDLSGYTNVPIAVRFYSYYRSFQIDELSVAFSNDNGSTWGEPIDYRSFQANLAQGFITVVLPSAATEAVPDLSQCRLKFTFEGNYYFAMIDDVTILGNTSLSVSEPHRDRAEVGIYPNPSADYIHVTNRAGIIAYSIIDLLGKEVGNGVLGHTSSIDIRHLGVGTYFLRLDNGATLRFIRKGN